MLYGDTAIALRLGHRVSVDFDFFTEKPLARDALWEALPFMVHALVLQDAPNTLTVQVLTADTTQPQIKLSFFGTLGFGRVGAPDTTEDGVLQVASLNDLMATKVKVILQRAQAKDYCDIAAMLDAGVDLSVGLAAARAVFGTNFQPSESLKALVYFDDGDLHTLKKAEKSRLIEHVRAVRDLAEVVTVSKQLSVDPR